MVEPEVIGNLSKDPSNASVRPGPVQAARSVLSMFFSSQRSETTYAYLSDLRDFAKYCKSEMTHENIEKILFDDKTSSQKATALIEGYRDAMIQAGLVWHTINRRLSVIRGIVKVARNMGVVPTSWRIEVPGLPPPPPSKDKTRRKRP